MRQHKRTQIHVIDFILQGPGTDNCFRRVIYHAVDLITQVGIAKC